MLELDFQLQQDKQELSCDSEAASTELSLAQPLPKAAWNEESAAAATGGWGFLHLQKVEQAAVYSYLHQGELERELGQIPEVLGAATALPSHKSHHRDVPMWNSFRGSLICRVPAAAHSEESTITDAQIQLEMGWKIIKIIQDHQVQLLTHHCQGPLNTMHTSATWITWKTAEKVAAWLNRFFFLLNPFFISSFPSCERSSWLSSLDTRGEKSKHSQLHR